METIQTPTIDKTSWGEGPWQTEPDRVDFVHAGYACLALRHSRHGHWCGYVGVPAGHPAYALQVDALPWDLAVNYAAKCSPPVCHVPAPGMPRRVWWLGFDCAHIFDYSPGTAARIAELARTKGPQFARRGMELQEVYRDLPYVRRKIENLADTLAAISRGARGARGARDVQES